MVISNIFTIAASRKKVRQLADFAIRHYWSHLADDEDKYRLWFSDVVARTASLIAQWQTVGFAHGVMNTDNMSLLGLTLDYGPFGFLDDYEPGFICNHSDHQGRYSFDNQPAVALWNLQRLAQTLSPFVAVDALNEATGQLSAGFVDALWTTDAAETGLHDGAKRG